MKAFRTRRFPLSPVPRASSLPKPRPTPRSEHYVPVMGLHYVRLQDYGRAIGDPSYISEQRAAAENVMANFRELVIHGKLPAGSYITREWDMNVGEYLRITIPARPPRIGVKLRAFFESKGIKV
jgi:hypothetical protein